MKIRIAAVMILITLNGPALAGFEDGVAAAKRGDYATAHREFGPLAEAGDPQAQHNLGVMYYNGRGVERNFIEAAKWFRRAAERGVAEAQSSLGYMYQKGEGITQDYAQSTRWYRKAAEQGFGWAQYSLGAAYAAGEGVGQDMAEGARWYRRAAAHGLEVPAWTTLPSVFTQAPAAGPRTLMKTASAGAAATGKVAEQAAEKNAARSGPAKTKKAPVRTALKDTKQKTPSGASAAADAEPAGKGAAAGTEPADTGTMGTKAAAGGATGGVTPASALPITYAPAPPVAPARLYDPPAPARVVAPSPPSIKAPPPSGSQAPTIGSRPKAASAWRIQIGAVASTKAAKKEWQRIASANEDLLSKLKPDIRRADLGARGVFYRVQAGPLESESEARAVCKALLERKVNCFIVPVK